MIINVLGHEHDQVEHKNQWDKKCQIKDLEDIFFPAEILKIPRVCKKSIMGAKPLHTQLGMPCHELSRRAMFP